MQVPALRINTEVTEEKATLGHSIWVKIVTQTALSLLLCALSPEIRSAEGNLGTIVNEATTRGMLTSTSPAVVLAKFPRAGKCTLRRDYWNIRYSRHNK